LTAPSRQRRKPREAFALEDTLQAWAESARDVLIDLLSIDEATAARLAREIVVRFAEDHPGQTIYLAKGVAFKLDVRDELIYKEFNGHNHNALAKKYNVTPRHIRRLVIRASAIDTAQRIDDMFPGREIPDRH
jgi:Mor family transcriptional regulator